MEDLKKEFVPYEFALRMKALGFDEPCFGFHSPIHDLMICNTKSVNEVAGECLAPTFSQAFRWFREKYNLRGFIGFRPNVKMFDYHIYDMSLSGLEYTKQRTMEEFNKDPKVGTYEEAELACLKKLIEIVEQKEKI
jgi:hypothetical protein